MVKFLILNSIFYFNPRINIVDILWNLVLVIITTFFTYLFLTEIPKYRRKKIIRQELLYLHFALCDCFILDENGKYKNSYILHDNTFKIENRKREYELDIKKSNDFYKGLKDFQDSIKFFNSKMNKQMFLTLTNSYFLDSKNYITMYMKLSELMMLCSNEKIYNFEKGGIIRNYTGSEEVEYELVLQVKLIEEISELSTSIISIIEKTIGKV